MDLKKSTSPLTAQFDFIEPFQNYSVTLSELVPISRGVIADLLKKALDIKNTRNRALTRLFFLLEHNLLTVKDKGKFQKVVWGHLDQNGFPDDTNYYYFAFLETKKFSTGIDVSNIFRQYIMSNTFNIQGQKEGGISMTRGEDRYAIELSHGSANVNDENGIKWTLEEMDNIIEKCVSWWDIDNDFLVNDYYKDDRFGGSIYEEFLSRFRLLANIICKVLGYQRDTITSSSLLKVTRLIYDMESKSVPVLKVKIAFADILNYSEDNFINELINNINSGKQANVVDALEAAAIGLFYFEKHIRESFVSPILHVLIQPITWRNSELTVECLSIIDNIFTYKPECYHYIKKPILNGLEYLHTYTDTTKERNEQSESIQRLLLLRQRAMSLASTIFTIEKDDTSIEIQHWQNIAESPNEFGEIKRRWKHINLPS